MNINSMRDADNDIGIYFAVCPTVPNSAWGGALIYESRNSGSSYDSRAFTDRPVPIGVANNALGIYQGGNTVDEVNVIDVTLRWGQLVSTNHSGLLSGANACVLGSEIIYFRDALQTGELRYSLRGLLRGRRGSEYAMGTHVASERFVLYDVDAWVRYVPDASSLRLSVIYRGATAGYPAEASQTRSLTNQGNGLRPYAPAHLGGGRNAAGDITLNWTRRTRIGGEWANSQDVPLGESSQQYEVEIYSSSLYTQVVRTITGIASAFVTYAAAEQTADFGSLQSTLYFRVYQVSSVIGRGFAATGQV